MKINTATHRATQTLARMTGKDLAKTLYNDERTNGWGCKTSRNDERTIKSAERTGQKLKLRAAQTVFGVEWHQPQQSHARLRAGIRKNMTTKQYYVYILTKERNSTFYVGITSDLAKRVWQHKNETADGFTKKYNIKRLVYFEVFDDPENAIRREKRLKKWTRSSKIRAIEELNPNWDDLYGTVCK